MLSYDFGRPITPELLRSCPCEMRIPGGRRHVCKYSASERAGGRSDVRGRVVADDA